MKKKAATTRRKKLSIAKTTLRLLTDAQLKRDVVGGTGTTTEAEAPSQTYCTCQ